MTLQQCIDDCLDCHRSCLESIQALLERGVQRADLGQLSTLQTCATMCDTTAQFMIYKSDLHPKSCALCAEICERTAEVCEQRPDDLVLRQCAEICRRTASSCRVMAGQRAA